MKVIDLINNSKGTAFSFEILPPLKGTGIEKLYQTIDTLREFDPKQWFELARCKYDAPQGFDSVSLLKDNVASERCAILRYQEIADFTNGKDFTTCDIAKHILAEEEEHEQDLQDYLTDIARMKKSFLEK